MSTKRSSAMAVLKRNLSSLSVKDWKAITEERAKELAGLLSSYSLPQLRDLRVGVLYRKPVSISDCSITEKVDKKLLSIQGVFGIIYDERRGHSDVSGTGIGLSRTESMNEEFYVWGLLRSGEWAMFKVSFHWWRNGGEYGQENVSIGTCERVEGPISLDDISKGSKRVLQDVFARLGEQIQRWLATQEEGLKKLRPLAAKCAYEDELLDISAAT